MGPTWGPPGSCRPQMGPMLAPWTLLPGLFIIANLVKYRDASKKTYRVSGVLQIKAPEAGIILVVHTPDLAI